jgi:DNA repair exonuclease SbcCD ATPase subunit
MKKITEDKKLKILYYYDVGIPPFAIAIALKISETSVKSILTQNNRHGPPPTFTQAYNTWLYLNQQFGEAVLIDSSKDNQQREQKLKEKINVQEVRITQLTNDLQKATEQEQNQKQELEKKNKEFQQKNKENEDLKQRLTLLTKEKQTEKLEKEKLQNKVYEQYERLIKIVRELGEQKTKVNERDQHIKTIEKEHHETLENLDASVTTLISKLQHSEKMNTTLTEEKTQLKQEVQKLKREQQTAWIKYITAVLLGTGIGVLADRMILRLNIESETHRI